MNEPKLPEGITYGGEGPGGEFYSKEVDSFHAHSIWTKGEESWTGDELQAIAYHQKYLEQSKCPHENISTYLGLEHNTQCDDCGAEL